jgi:transcriptional regulator with XRE-family HTH domain
MESTGNRVASTICHLKLNAAKPRGAAYPAQIRTLGDHLRARRLDLGLLQREVAKRIACDESTITNWELNRVRPALQFLPRIVKFLGYDPFAASEAGTLAEEIKQHREKLGLSRKRLAKLLGTDPSNLAGWETEKHKPTKKSQELIKTFLIR